VVFLVVKPDEENQENQKEENQENQKEENQKGFINVFNILLLYK